MKYEQGMSGSPNGVVAIIQARTGSTRLPGKVLLPLGGRTMLGQIIRRVGQARGVDRVVVATSIHPADDPIAALAAAEGVGSFRGSEADVLDRYLGAAREAGAAHIVRITGDCPFVDPDVVDQVIAAHLEASADYTSNTVERSFPHGADVEVFTRAALETAAAMADDPAEREHVTPYIWRRPDQFRIVQAQAPPPLRHPEYRLTVDTQEDYMLARAVYESFPSESFSLAEVLALFDRCPWLPYINRQVTQKLVVAESDPERALALECLHVARWAEAQDLSRVAALLREEARRRVVSS